MFVEPTLVNGCNICMCVLVGRFSSPPLFLFPQKSQLVVLLPLQSSRFRSPVNLCFMRLHTVVLKHGTELDI